MHAQHQHQGQMVPTRLSQVATRACCGCAPRFHIITLFYHFKMSIAFNHLVFYRYYPKQKEYKIEDLILESNMEVYSNNQPLWHLSSCDHESSSFTRLPSCKLKLADLCREVMEPQQGTGRDGSNFSSLKRWGTEFPLDLKFGGGPQKI